MKQPRFIMTDIGLVLETPVPLSFRQRDATRKYAIEVYSKRVLQVPSGSRREGLYNIIKLLNEDNFVERPIPAHDCDREAIIYGK